MRRNFNKPDSDLKILLLLILTFQSLPVDIQPTSRLLRFRAAGLTWDAITVPHVMAAFLNVDSPHRDTSGKYVSLSSPCCKLSFFFLLKVALDLCMS